MERLGSTINVAVVGLGFGREFLPIYLEDPRVGSIAICDQSADTVAHVGEEFGITDRFYDLGDVLLSDRYDAVHVATPVSTHARFAAAVLASGKHCACAVPIATALEDIDLVIAAESKSHRIYMMMETSVYTREYFFVQHLYNEGAFGAISLLRGMHIQDLDGFPQYWLGFPPMYYVTHALAPLLALVDDRVDTVNCRGSGHLPAEISSSFDNPYPAEIALFHLAHHDLTAEVTRASFGLARSYQEGFSVYGERIGFEWGQLEDEPPVLFEFLPRVPGQRGRQLRETRVEIPDRADLLPKTIASFTRPLSYDPPNGRLGVVDVPSHHGGSHPHLAHEFLSSIAEGRRSRVDARMAATWTAPGVCAHSSAMLDGERVSVNDYGQDRFQPAPSSSQDPGARQ